MAHFRDSVPSSLGPEETFDYLAWFSNVREWDPGVVEAEPLGEAPARIGSRFRVVTEFAGRRNDLVYEIVELERPHRVRLVAEAPSFTSDDTIEVAGPQGGVTVTYDAALRMKGLFRLSEPITRVIFNRVAGKAKDGLAKTLAQRPGPGSR